FCFDFRYACDAPAKVSQQWYQSQGEGRPHAYCLHTEVVGHGQAPCRVGRPWPGYLQGVTGCGQARCKGRPPAGTIDSGQPARGCHPRPALPLAGAVLVAGVAAPW
ncbi:hypothetical protein B296_00057789, partial [Ensete ventricosum]